MSYTKTALPLVLALAACAPQPPEISLPPNERNLTGLFNTHYGLREFEACTAPDGQTARISAETTSSIFYNFGLFLGYSRKDPQSGEITIGYDAEIFPYLPPQAQLFVNRHECIHVLAGHLEHDIYGLSAENIEALEDEADCQTMKTLRDEFAWTTQDVDILINTLETAHAYFKQITPAAGPMEIVYARGDKLRTCFRQP